MERCDGAMQNQRRLGRDRIFIQQRGLDFQHVAARNGEKDFLSKGNGSGREGRE